MNTYSSLYLSFRIFVPTFLFKVLKESNALELSAFQNTQSIAEGIYGIFDNDFLCEEFLKYQYFASSLFKSDRQKLYSLNKRKKTSQINESNHDWITPIIVKILDYNAKNTSQINESNLDWITRPRLFA